MRNQPWNVWKSEAVTDPDLRWLLNNQREIVNNKEGARKMKEFDRPLKMWHDGRVRVEFIGTYKSASEAREFLSQFVK